MSTAATSSARFDANVPTGAIVRRFLWKEFRMLRGLWLAVAILAAIIQWTLNVLTPPSVDHASLLFSTALAATVLYAVGAAATSMSVEHEEETFDFLAVLPTTWWPVYVGKLIVVVTSAVALASLLSVVGWMLCRFDRPGGHDAAVALGLFGVAILEGTAWGMLFSLLMTRPLVAAILALVAGTIAVNVAVYLSSSQLRANLSPSAYLEALPLRLAIVTLVVAWGAIVARRWLTGGTTSGAVAHGQAAVWWGGLWRRVPILRRRTENAQPRGARRRMLARLLWQTWRDASKLLMLPIGIAALLILGLAAVVMLAEPRAELKTAVMASTLLFVPALFGAMAFTADQRRGRYRFLAEHAARPRYVWLARHVVWLGALVGLTVVIWLLATATIAIAFRFSIAERPISYFAESGQLVGFGAVREAADVVDEVFLIGLGMLTAYGVGQFCSMLMRSGILSAFVALVVSIFLTGWAAVLFAWQLSGLLFLLPVAVAFMLATWLRIPDWIAGRNSWQTWLRPVLVVITTLVLVGVAMPFARLAQIPERPKIKRFLGMTMETASPVSEVQLRTADQLLVNANRIADTRDARETAEMYLRAVELLHSWEDNNPLEAWEKPEFALSSSDSRVTAIDEAKIPPDQLEAFLEAKQRQLELKRESESAAVKLAIEASARPTCHFDFDFNPTVDFPPIYIRLNELLVILWRSESNPGFDRLLAALRMSAHLRMDQPSVAFIDQLFKEQAILEQIGNWAANESRTREELDDALDQLTAHFRVLTSIRAALIADHGLVEDVLLGQTGPLALARDPQSLPVYLAYLANQLSWEQERALAAMQIITLQNVSVADDLTGYLGYWTNFNVRRWLRPIHRRDWTEPWVLAQPAAATSYLARLEYEARASVSSIYRAYCDNQVFRRAALLQIALAMYRHDHGEYPTRLNELVSDYLDQLPLDPYSGQPFGYEPAGLDLPLFRSGIGSNFKRIEANTPLFWSVGAGNARLKVEVQTLHEYDENNPQGEVTVMTVTSYVLASEDPLWWFEPAFAFALPK